MKKIIPMVLIVISIIFIVGCNECEIGETKCENDQQINCVGGEWDYDNPTNCMYGCTEVKCNCQDSDGGLVYDEFGTASDGKYMYDDRCLILQDGVYTRVEECTGCTLQEGYCEDDVVTNIAYPCEGVCRHGACAEVSAQESWLVGTSSKTLEISESLTSGTNMENIRNIVTRIDDTEMPNTLSDGLIRNNRGEFNYGQSLNFDNYPSEYVMMKKDGENNVGDMFFVGSSDYIAEYDLTFKQDLESSIVVDNLVDIEDRDIEMLGEVYTIAEAELSSDNGVELLLFGGPVKDVLEEGQTETYSIDGLDYEVSCLAITDSAPLMVKFRVRFGTTDETTNSIPVGGSDVLSDGTRIAVTSIIPNEAGNITLDMVEFYLGATKVVLRDDDIRDVVSTHNLILDDNSIVSENVIIEGSVSEIVQLNKISVLTLADHDLYVEAGESLSEQANEIGLLLSSIDFTYEGLLNVPLERIEILNSGTEKYDLIFSDADGNEVNLPLAYATGGSNLKSGNADNKLVLDEVFVITEDDYFILENSEQSPGNRDTYALQYTGATANLSDQRVITFENVATGDSIQEEWDSAPSGDPIAALNLGGQDYNIYAASPTYLDDFDLQIDLNGDTSLDTNDKVAVTTNAGAQIRIIDNTDVDYMDVYINTPDADDYESLVPSPVQFRITAADGKLNLIETGPLMFEHPVGAAMVQTYTSLGALVYLNVLSPIPEVLIDYPTLQKTPQVYIVSK